MTAKIRCKNVSHNPVVSDNLSSFAMKHNKIPSVKQNPANSVLMICVFRVFIVNRVYPSII